MFRTSPRSSRWLAGSAVIILLTGALVFVGGAAEAAKAGTCEGYTVTVAGQSFTGNQQVTVPAAQVGTPSP